jgi:serine/threonine kinase 32
MQDIRKHPWFKGIDWDNLELKESQPPFVPDVSLFHHRFVTPIFMGLQMKQANFDVTHELDEFLMVERPLQHTKRKANPDLDKMKPELRQLQEESVSPRAL